MNPYYDHTTFPSTGAAGSSSSMRSELDAIEAGFDKLPTIAGNGLKIVGINSGETALVAVATTGTGSVVLATSPTLTTPALGVATATTVNKVALTAPATGATVTIADGKTFTLSNTLTFTGTDASSVAFGTGGTVAYTANTLAAFAATTSAQLAGIISDETGSGALVFGTSPTLVTPTIGVATATSVNKVSITAPATSATLTVADGKTLTASNTLTLTGTDGSSIAFGTGGTVIYAAALSASTGSSLSGHIASGTGAVATTVGAKLRESVSAADFGAVGDGATSSAAAFSSAYADATASETIHVGPGNFVTGTVTGSKSVLWDCDGSMNSAGTTPLDLPGVVETHFSRRKLIRQSQSTDADYAVMQVQRLSTHAGGTAGFVNCGLRSDISVSAGVTNYEWALVGAVDNSATAGENVGVYGQGYQRATGPTWGGTFEARDLRNTADTLGGLVGLEADVFANGSDANNTRVGVDVVVGKGTSGGVKCTAYCGLRITPVNADTSQGDFLNGIIVQGNCTTGISLSSSGTTSLLVTGTNANGINLSLATFSGSAIRLDRTQKISFDNTDALMLGLDSSINVFRFDNAGTERVGLDARATTPGLRVNGTQVVGARDTGWAAFTGATNEATTYATGTVTLVQLAERVAAMQVALTTHGLLGV